MFLLLSSPCPRRSSCNDLQDFFFRCPSGSKSDRPSHSTGTTPFFILLSPSFPLHCQWKTKRSTTDHPPSQIQKANLARQPAKPTCRPTPSRTPASVAKPSLSLLLPAAHTQVQALTASFSTLRISPLPRPSRIPPPPRNSTCVWTSPRSVLSPPSRIPRRPLPAQVRILPSECRARAEVSLPPLKSSLKRPGTLRSVARVHFEHEGRSIATVRFFEADGPCAKFDRAVYAGSASSAWPHYEGSVTTRKFRPFRASTKANVD